MSDAVTISKKQRDDAVRRLEEIWIHNLLDWAMGADTDGAKHTAEMLADLPVSTRRMIRSTVRGKVAALIMHAGIKSIKEEPR